MTRRKDVPRSLAPADPAESPAERLDRFLAAPVLQPWPARWNEPVFLAPPRPGLLGDRWRSVFAGFRAPAHHARASIVPPSAGSVRSLASAAPAFTRPAWRLPVTEPLMRARQPAPPPSPPPRRGPLSP